MESDRQRRGAIGSFVTLHGDGDVIGASWDVAECDEDTVSVNGFVRGRAVDRFGAVVDEADGWEALEGFGYARLYREGDRGVRAGHEDLSGSRRCRRVADRLRHRRANGGRVDRDRAVVSRGSGVGAT